MVTLSGLADWPPRSSATPRSPGVRLAGDRSWMACRSKEHTMVTMARGAVLRAFNEPLTIEEAPVLEPGPGAVLARVELGGICGTDVHLQHGNLPIPTPVILGHEAVGRVEKHGEGVTTDFNGEPLRVGDAIAWASSIPCGQ